VTLDVLSADGQTIRFLADSTSKVSELDEENNSSEVSVLDVMTHDIAVESLTPAEPIDFTETTTFRWVIANNGPGRALNLNAHATIFHVGGGSTALAVVVISSLESGATTTGVTKYLPVAGDRFVITIETPDQVEVNDLDNTAEVLVDDLQA
jgi:subtilase family serine protease